MGTSPHEGFSISGESPKNPIVPTLDAGRGSGRLPWMNTGSLYFRNGFAGWFYFSPVCWRLRLR